MDIMRVQFYAMWAGTFCQQVVGGRRDYGEGGEAEALSYANQNTL